MLFKKEKLVKKIFLPKKFLVWISIWSKKNWSKKILVWNSVHRLNSVTTTKKLGEGSRQNKKCHKIEEKVHNFLDPPPLDNVDYFEFGKTFDPCKNSTKILSNCYNGIISIIHQPYMYEIMPISYLYVTIKVYGRRFT